MNRKKKIKNNNNNDLYNFMQALPEQLRREKAARQKYNEKIKKRLYVRRNEGVQYHDRQQKPMKSEEEIRARLEEKRLKLKILEQEIQAKLLAKQLANLNIEKPKEGEGMYKTGRKK